MTITELLMEDIIKRELTILFNKKLLTEKDLAKLDLLSVMLNRLK